MNDLMILRALRADPDFKVWPYENLVMNLYYYLTAVDKQYFERLTTLAAIVADIKDAFGIKKDKKCQKN